MSPVPVVAQATRMAAPGIDSHDLPLRELRAATHGARTRRVRMGHRGHHVDRSAIDATFANTQQKARNAARDARKQAHAHASRSSIQRRTG